MLPAAPEVKGVYYLLSLMPAMTQSGIMTKAYNSDYKFTSIWIAVSSILGAVSLPLYVWMIENVFKF